MEQITIETTGQHKQMKFWRADVPTRTRPAVIGSKIVDGIKYYLGPMDQEYLASAFDKMFGVAKLRKITKSITRNSTSGGRRRKAA